MDAHQGAGRVRLSTSISESLENQSVEYPSKSVMIFLKYRRIHTCMSQNSTYTCTVTKIDICIIVRNKYGKLMNIIRKKEESFI